MNRTAARRSNKMNALFTGLLFLVFVLCALFTVLIGSRVYENITVRSNRNFTGTTALSYIANKVRQGDREGMVEVREIDGVPVLVLGQDLNDTRYETWIYYQDGSVKELFSNPESGLGLKDGLDILECSGLDVSLSDRLLTIRTLGEGGGSLRLYLRSGGIWENEWEAWIRLRAVSDGNDPGERIFYHMRGAVRDRVCQGGFHQPQGQGYQPGGAGGGDSGRGD